MIEVTFGREVFNRQLGTAMAAARDPRAMLMGAGRECGNVLRRHFQQKDQTGANHLSARREHFWLQIMRAVQSPAWTGAQVTVAIRDPRIAQKVFGGPIVAKDKDALTIPVEERAYGRSASTFEQETGLKLFLIKTGGKGGNKFENAVLAVMSGFAKGFTVEYILTPKIEQDEDPTALPDEGAMEQAVLARANRIVQRQTQGQQPDSLS